MAAKDLIPYQWKKGQSGNYKGRPKQKTLLELLRDALAETECAGQPNPNGWQSDKCLIDAMIIHAIKGNAAYMREIWDRVQGKVPDPEPPKAEIDMEQVAQRNKEKRAKRKKHDSGS